MEFELSCANCGTDLEYGVNSEKINTTVDCECGARYAVTISLLTG